MGGLKSEDRNSLTKEIWEWYIESNLWISAAHKPGCNNVEANLYSREPGMIQNGNSILLSLKIS